MSTSTTSRQTSDSAMRIAVVAPTLPAPMTVAFHRASSGGASRMPSDQRADRRLAAGQLARQAGRARDQHVVADARTDQVDRQEAPRRACRRGGADATRAAGRASYAGWLDRARDLADDAGRGHRSAHPGGDHGVRPGLRPVPQRVDGVDPVDEPDHVARGGVHQRIGRDERVTLGGTGLVHRLHEQQTVLAELLDPSRAHDATRDAAEVHAWTSTESTMPTTSASIG